MNPSRSEEWVAGSVPDSLFILITDRVLQRFYRGVVVWRALRHPNILPLLGVTITEDHLVALSEWMMDGTITEFVKVHVNVDRLGLVRFSPEA